jgi:arylsulfatase
LAGSGKISLTTKAWAAKVTLSPTINTTPFQAPATSSCCDSDPAKAAIQSHNQMVSATIAQTGKKPNILVIWGDDIGTWNISHNNRGMMGYKTPNIDRIAREGVSFTDYYGQQSCTAGRAAFLGGNVPVRTGMTKVGLPGAKEGWQKSDVTIATVLKGLGYTTGQFGKNHQGDRDDHLPTVNGFDEFFGNLYHLNAEEEPENRDYPKDMKLQNGKTFLETYGPRGVLKCKADGKGGQTIENTGPLTKKRMETIDEETLASAKEFISRKNKREKLQLGRCLPCPCFCSLARKIPSRHHSQRLGLP